MIWEPTEKDVVTSNIGQWLEKKSFKTYEDLFRWSVEHYTDFWREVIDEFKIPFHSHYDQIVDLSKGVENPQWLPGARLNIAEACFKAPPEKTAIRYERIHEPGIQSLSYGELNERSNRVAHCLLELGFQKGDAIAIDMPMTVEAVIIYLGIVKMGGVVVSIADSFASEGIALRLRLSEAKLVFTQDEISRGDKKISLYDKVMNACDQVRRGHGEDRGEKTGEGASDIKIVVLSERDQLSKELHPGELREQDLSWNDFLGFSTEKQFVAASCAPEDSMNILFSSGTTGEPKVIPWTHITPIKSAMDGFFHHNIQGDDVVAWPTNLGWMMGPWLLYASLINEATMALCEHAPLDEKFGRFVEQASVTVLGLVPSLVKVWRSSGCMESCDWSSIKLFSSTGECSNPDDYRYLMSLASNRPVIEYCGGTEIGGGYISGTVVQKSIPSKFSTPTLGLDFVLLNEHHEPSDEGEVFLIPPSIGLSHRLLNRDHHAVYFEGVPPWESKVLRRHGDCLIRDEEGYYQARGRTDDTMNLGGIKVSSAEIEQVLNLHSDVAETAAVAVAPEGGGADQLVVFVVLSQQEEIEKNKEVAERELLKNSLQEQIKNHLNPLFKIHELVSVEKLPRTASNKIMRRVLRDKLK